MVKTVFSNLKSLRLFKVFVCKVCFTLRYITMKKKRSFFVRLFRSFVYAVIYYERWKREPKNAEIVYGLRRRSFGGGFFLLL